MKKRSVVKIVFPVLSLCVVLSVFLWPQRKVAYHFVSMLSNQASGIVYHGRSFLSADNARNKDFVLNAKSATETQSKKIMFDAPVLTLSEGTVSAQSATLDIENEKLTCAGNVELQYNNANIKVKKAIIH